MGKLGQHQVIYIFVLTAQGQYSDPSDSILYTDHIPARDRKGLAEPETKFGVVDIGGRYSRVLGAKPDSVRAFALAQICLLVFMERTYWCSVCLTALTHHFQEVLSHAQGLNTGGCLRVHTGGGHSSSGIVYSSALCTILGPHVIA